MPLSHRNVVIVVVSTFAMLCAVAVLLHAWLSLKFYAEGVGDGEAHGWGSIPAAAIVLSTLAFAIGVTYGRGRRRR